MLEDREDGDDSDATGPRDLGIESPAPPPGPSERPENTIIYLVN